MKETSAHRSALNFLSLLPGRKTVVRAALAATCLAAAAPLAQAIVHFNPPSIQFENAPTNGLPWDNVGRLCNASGGGTTGSVVAIKGKYCLTANHVALADYVTFDGVTLYERDTSFTPIRFAQTDMKLIKLVEDPGLPEIKLNETDNTDTSLFPIHMVGWGVGVAADQTAAEAINGYAHVWRWGNSATIAKRWGTNRSTRIFNYSDSNYTYAAIYAQMNSNPPETSEAALTTFDSGSGAFVFHSGQWHLSGIATQSSSIATASSSSFSTATATRDMAQWVRVFTYASQIKAAIPDTTTISGWAADNGLSGANALPDADPDNDGIPNLAEFAFGTNPKGNSTSQAPQLVIDNAAGTTAMRYRLSNTATGFTVQVMHSDDMVNWSPAPGTPVIVDDSASDYTVYELAVTPSNDSYRFYTVTVTQN